MHEKISNTSLSASSMPGRYLEDFKVGEKFVTQTRKITATELEDFARISWLDSPAHLDDEFAKTTPFGVRIAQEMLVESIVGGLWYKTGLTAGTFISHIGHTAEFPGKAKIGDEITVDIEVKAITEMDKDKGQLTVVFLARNQLGQNVGKVELDAIIKRRP